MQKIKCFLPSQPCKIMLPDYRIMNFRVKYDFSIFQLHFPFIHDDILFYKVYGNTSLIIYVKRYIWSSLIMKAPILPKEVAS